MPVTAGRISFLMPTYLFERLDLGGNPSNPRSPDKIGLGYGFYMRDGLSRRARALRHFSEDAMDGTTQLLDTDRQFLVHPLHHPEDHKAPLFIDRGEGAMLYDIAGRGVIDGLSGL